MPAQRCFGMDHEHYDWWPIIKRGTLRWPGNARVAVCVIVNLEYLEWSPPKGSFQSSTIAGGRGSRPSPNYLRFSHREYGHRVGIFRVLDVLEKHGIKATVAMDALTAENYPYLVRHCASRGCEFIGHGISVSRMITSSMSEEEERQYIQTSLEALRSSTGNVPLGWLGPEHGESFRTPQLLAEAGIRYVCDWANDEQPYPMKTRRGKLLSLPTLMDLDDVDALLDRRVPIEAYAKLLKDAFEILYRNGARSGRMMVLNLHPWLIGQPFRIGFLDDALAYIMRHKDVWAATGWEITEGYRRSSSP